MVVHEMQSQEDYEEVLKKRAVVIDAVAEWCQPCKMVAPQFLKFSEDPKNEGIHFTKFDIDEMPEVAEGFEITIMPTFVYLIDGKVVEKVEGLNLPKLNRTTAEFSERVRAMAAAAASSENGAESNGHDATGENGNGLEKDKDMPVLETDREDW
jgi:thioredoxin 1